VRARLSLAGTLLLATVLGAGAQTPSGEQRFRDVYRELIEINTVSMTGNTTRAAEAMAARLRAAGLPPADVHVLGAHPRKGNLVARLRGSGGAAPLLLLAHLDVVEARREDWSTDPFTLVEKDGYFYGRGTVDDKAMAAIFVDVLIRFREAGFTPNRDLIVALTADEELGATAHNGVRWLLDNHRALIEAEFAINEGGGGELRSGRHVLNRIQTSEKVPMTYRLEVANPGGHSSRPRKDNAIYRLADGLGRLARFDFPASLNETTRAYFERTAALWTGERADDMRRVAGGTDAPDAVARLSADASYNATLRTTCVATRLEAGHANNALPQTARANVNCRILPQERAAEVERTLAHVLADPQIAVTTNSREITSPPSPLRPDLLAHVERITSEMWPGTAVIPTMGTGATDSRFLRNAGIHAYGVSGLFVEATDNRTHGRDERIAVRDLFAGREFLFRLVQTLSGGR
jgi:acetylornithine deacetylase/succinyl-diaminopimelate desuccinylase-like protein